MTIASETLLQDLIERTRKNINQSEKFRQLPLDQLNGKIDQQRWSILECIQHLNLYGDFYIPEIHKRIQLAPTSPEPLFRSGLLGNYFAISMMPKEKLNKMKTFRDKDPIGSDLNKECIERFIVQQQSLLEALDASRKISLTKTRTAISISKWIKLKLGDTFRFVIYHNERHMIQAQKALEDFRSAR